MCAVGQVPNTVAGPWVSHHIPPDTRTQTCMSCTSATRTGTFRSSGSFKGSRLLALALLRAVFHRSSQKKKHTHAKACPSGEIPRRSLQARTAGANPPESVSPTPFKTHQPRTAWCLSVRVFLSGGKRPQKQPRESWKNWKNSSSLSQQTNYFSFATKIAKNRKIESGEGGPHSSHHLSKTARWCEEEEECEDRAPSWWRRRR